jgi:hypothetical protein
VYLLVGAMLASAPSGQWVRPGDLAAGVAGHHPYWNAGTSVVESDADLGVRAFVFGVLFQLRLVEAARDRAGEYWVRLSPFGRSVLLGEPAPPSPSGFPQTLLVQPNYEVLVYRQGMTPELIAQLSRFAVWKTVGAACTMELQADRLYRGLESGLTFGEVEQTLARHGMRPIPSTVHDALRSWARKRERVVVFPSATLLEFASPADLDDAVARGLIDQRVSPVIGLKYDEQSIDYRHLRLIGNRDYEARPEQCVRVDEDGVTLGVDASRSDLLLETELARFAERLEGGSDGQRRYRLTQKSLRSAREIGSTLQSIDEWLVTRSGAGLSAAARLLAGAHELPPVRVGRLLVVRVASPEIADGLMQWPETRRHIEDRLGPRALLVPEENLAALLEQLRALGLAVDP